MDRNELNKLAIYLDKAVKTGYFEDLNHFLTWKDCLDIGEVRMVLNTLIGYMLPDLDTDISEKLAED